MNRKLPFWVQSVALTAVFCSCAATYCWIWRFERTLGYGEIERVAHKTINLAMPALIIYLGTRFLSQFVGLKRNCNEADAVFGSLAFAYVLLAFVIFAMGVPQAFQAPARLREAGGKYVSIPTFGVHTRYSEAEAPARDFLTFRAR